MSRLLLAVMLLAPALARAQSDAYGSLVGMADAAKTDKGPDAEEMPADKPGDEEPKTAAPEPAKADEETPEAAAAPKPETKAAPVPAVKREKAEPRRDDEGPAVAVPATQNPRPWTKLFSSLLPQPSRPPSFEVAASTRAAGPAAPRPATAVSTEGSAQGLLEVFSAANAPYGLDEIMRDAVAEKPAARR